jgi:hypothetical protein
MQNNNRSESELMEIMGDEEKNPKLSEAASEKG